jgi:hypothetical protein
MKAALSMLVVLSSVFAFAATERYDVGAAYVVPAQRGVSPGDEKFCPQIRSAQIEVKDGSLDATSLVLTTASDSIALKSDGSSQQCYSDIVCPTSDDFSSQDLLVMIERKNDGEYPTTDLPGHTHMSVLIQKQAGESLACYYELK